MAGPVDGISGAAGIGGGAPTELRISNPAGLAAEGGDLSAMTAAAERALAGIGRLQQGFEANVAPSAEGQNGVSAMTGSDPARAAENDTMNQARMMIDQIEQTTQVQAQLVQFVMASSVSSSLGRNLNMFLRGQ